MPVFCQNCGVSNPDESQFCYSCGKPVSKQYDPPTTIAQEVFQPDTTVEVTASNMIEYGIDFLKQNPNILLLLIFSVPISIFSTYLLTSQMSNLPFLVNYDPYSTSLPVISFGPYFFEYLILSIVMDLLVNSFFTSWILTSYKQITFEGNRQNLDLKVAFTNSLRYIVSLIVVRLIVALIIVLAVIVFVCVFILLFFGVITGGTSNIGLSIWLIFGLFIALLIVIIYISVLYTYTDQAIILGNKSALSSFLVSSEMAKNRFWNTFGLIFAFGLFSSLISGVAENPLMLVPITMFLYLLRVCCLAWGYQEYFQVKPKRTLEDKR